METQASTTQSKMPEEECSEEPRKEFFFRSGCLKSRKFNVLSTQIVLLMKLWAIPRQNCLECTGSTSGRVVESDLHRALCQCGYEVTARRPATLARGVFSFRCIRCIILDWTYTHGETRAYCFPIYLVKNLTLRRLLSAGMKPVQSKSVPAVSPGCHLDMRERLHQHCSFFCSTRDCTLLAE